MASHPHVKEMIIPFFENVEGISQGFIEDFDSSDDFLPFFICVFW